MTMSTNHSTKMVKKMVHKALAEAYGEQQDPVTELEHSGVQCIDLNEIHPRISEMRENEERVHYMEVITQKESLTINASVLEIDQSNCEWQFSNDSMVYILNGQVELIEDNNVVAGTAGDLIYIPADRKVQILSFTASRMLHIKPVKNQ